MSHKIIPVQHSVDNIPPDARPVVGYEGIYAVTPDGRIFRVNGSIDACTGKELKQHISSNGYVYVTLKNKHSRKYKRFHRIIADAYIANPDKLPCINHINGNKADNHIENLEWCTYSQNSIHAYRILGIINGNKGKPSHRRGMPKTEGSGTPKRPIRGIHNTTGVTIEFESIGEASRQLNAVRAPISRACHGKSKSAYGYRWEFKVD